MLFADAKQLKQNKHEGLKMLWSIQGLSRKGNTSLAKQTSQCTRSIWRYDRPAGCTDQGCRAPGSGVTGCIHRPFSE
jgi:hypothetical protein